MKIRVLIRLKFQDLKKAEIFFRALKPEEKSIPTSRSRASIKLNPGEIEIEIIAPDFTSARAAVNSWFRWIEAINDSLVAITSIEK